MSEHESLAAALAAFQSEMPTVLKGNTANVPTKAGGSYRYTYADLADVTAAAMPVLTKHGLSFSCAPAIVDGRPVLTGALLHVSGQSREGTLPLNGASPQEIGSSLTYMRRYLLGALTGIVTDDDDDGQAAQQAAQARREAEQRAAAERAAAEARLTEARAVQRDLATWVRSHGMTPEEAIARWAAEHDGQHINHATDPTQLREFAARWQAEVAAQTGEPQ